MKKKFIMSFGLFSNINYASHLPIRKYSLFVKWNFQCIFFLIILYRYVIQSISSKRPTCIQSQVPKLAFEAVLCKLALTMKAKRPSLETFLEQNSKDVVAELQVLAHYVCRILETNLYLALYLQRPPLLVVAVLVFSIFIWAWPNH